MSYAVNKPTEADEVFATDGRTRGKYEYMYPCSVFKNTKDQLVLRFDRDGKFSWLNPAEALKALHQKAKETKLPIHSHTLYIKDGGTVPRLMVDWFGNPRIVVGTAREQRERAGMVKLA